MTAIIELEQSVSLIYDAMNKCTTESGAIRPEFRYKYAFLAQKLQAFQEVIEFLKYGEE